MIICYNHILVYVLTHMCEEALLRAASEQIEKACKEHTFLGVVGLFITTIRLSSTKKYCSQLHCHIHSEKTTQTLSGPQADNDNDPVIWGALHAA
jgi:hypothetical protein